MVSSSGSRRGGVQGLFCAVKSNTQSFLCVMSIPDPPNPFIFEKTFNEIYTYTSILQWVSLYFSWPGKDRGC